jgi:hypothetical protein
MFNDGRGAPVWLASRRRAARVGAAAPITARVIDASFRRQTSIALDHAILHFDRATHGVDHAAELDDRAVAGALNDAPVMSVDRGIDQVAP